MPRYRHDSRHTRKASVLLAVLVVVSTLSLAAYQYSDMMDQEQVAAMASLRQTQARALADSGIHYAAALLSDPDSLSGTLGNNTYDNDGSFKAIQVGQIEDGRRTGRFSIVAAIPVEDAGAQKFRYGVTDESGRLNINALIASGVGLNVVHNILMKLPNMTDEIADSIINWILPSTRTPQPNGADSSYYAGLQPPYRCKNGPLDTIEELLLVRGVTSQLLFGTDYNRNGIQDSGEDTGNGFDPGWAAYLTVYSRFRNVDSDGNARLNLNDTISQSYYDNLKTALGQPAADFIVLSSQNNPQADQADSTKSDAEITQNVIKSIIQRGGKLTLTSAWDLLDTSASGKGKDVTIMVPPPPRQPGQRGGGGQPRRITVKNPLGDQSQQQQLLPTLLDKTTTKSGQELPARINVLSAPQQVLTCLTGIGTQGGLTDADVQNILQARPALSSGQPTDDIYKTTAWMYLEAKIQPRTMAALEQYITSRTQVYRVEAIGYFDEGGPTARVEAVIDTNNGKPRVMMWRDLSELGKGYNLNQ